MAQSQWLHLFDFSPLCVLIQNRISFICLPCKFTLIVKIALLYFHMCPQITCVRNRVWHFGFETSQFRNFLIFLMVSVSVSENFGIEKSIGIGFGKIWYRKKYRYRFRKFLVSKKVSVSKNLVSKSIRFWNKKSSQKYQGVAMLVFADDRKSSQKYRGVVVLVSANPEILSKI